MLNYFSVYLIFLTFFSLPIMHIASLMRIIVHRKRLARRERVIAILTDDVLGLYCLMHLI